MQELDFIELSRVAVMLCTVRFVIFGITVLRLLGEVFVQMLCVTSSSEIVLATLADF